MTLFTAERMFTAQFRNCSPEVRKKNSISDIVCPPSALRMLCGGEEKRFTVTKNLQFTSCISTETVILYIG